MKKKSITKENIKDEGLDLKAHFVIYIYIKVALLYVFQSCSLGFKFFQNNKIIFFCMKSSTNLMLEFF